ncbi:Ubiquitin carboxyl-terminal hydrolase 5 [Trichoplax sp. H2]|nr:Ubiquitin carboxyl-terminal hydrolase 5 [Trichoplax sp. H2]|eukprot:RDD44181.1 Ubiquitin carboxyl-terminal hydrolase 5 [Trichoplax sp. H2]
MAVSLDAYLDRIRIPTAMDKVYKAECCYSFDTPVSDGGLYVCMSNFLSFGRNYVERYFKKTGHNIFLHLKKVAKPLKDAESGDEIESPPKKKPIRLAIGVEGGFDINVKQVDYEEINSIVLLPEFTVISLPNNNLPEKIQFCIIGILSVESASLTNQIQSWDGEERKTSIYAENLVQHSNPRRIPPSGWKCDVCGLEKNLWLNLTDGSILCGRKYFDGSGGNGHAVEHYEKTKYPLCVKLGTITVDGADVYSYAEDDMVLDPYLTKHLEHFGINITSMQKTEKTMAELEIDANMKLQEWDVIQESGRQLQPLSGPGYTGIKNLGNSCYLNSVMQVVFSIPDFQARYYERINDIFEKIDPHNIPTNLEAQMAKFGHGLLSGCYSIPSDTDGSEEQYGVTPIIFKNLIGAGHSEFSTAMQQDASEYLLHLINTIDKDEHKLKSSRNPNDSLRFEIEERIQCTKSNKVKYTSRTEYVLSLPIPQDSATNMQEFLDYQAKRKEAEARGEKMQDKDAVRPIVPLISCFNAFAEPELISDFFSTALGEKSTASKTAKIKSFPDYLFIQMKKFTVGEDWVPKKLDVIIDVADELDLAEYRGTGLKATEELLPEPIQEQAAQEEPAIDVGVVRQLSEMGFAFEGCRKAVYYTNNSGVEAAMSWVMDHMGDPDFADPLVLKSNTSKKTTFVADENGIATIISMGFTQEQANKALKATDNSVERAVDWIFSHVDDLDSMDTDENTQDETESKSKVRDGGTRYRLVAFISHMGSNTFCGHYVCHILKDGRWVIFNDRKVAISEVPPKGLAYLYLYKRL